MVQCEYFYVFLCVCESLNPPTKSYSIQNKNGVITAHAQFTCDTKQTCLLLVAQAVSVVETGS